MSMKWTYFIFFIPLHLQIQFKLQMFLIKIAQTNSAITDNYFQFGEEKKNTPKDKKKIGEGFQTKPNESEAFPTHISPSRGAV